MPKEYGRRLLTLAERTRFGNIRDVNFVLSALVQFCRHGAAPQNKFQEVQIELTRLRVRR